MILVQRCHGHLDRLKNQYPEDSGERRDKAASPAAHAGDWVGLRISESSAERSWRQPWLREVLRLSNRVAKEGGDMRCKRDVDVRRFAFRFLSRMVLRQTPRVAAPFAM